MQNKGTHANTHVRTRLFQHNACVRYGRQESALSGNRGGGGGGTNYCTEAEAEGPREGELTRSVVFWEQHSHSGI